MRPARFELATSASVLRTCDAEVVQTRPVRVVDVAYAVPYVALWTIVVLVAGGSLRAAL